MNWFNNPNNLFVQLLIGGGFLSCVVRVLSDAPITSAAWATVICFFCLLWYFLAARRDAAGRHTPDNVYYLGLLFTLLSLVYSLVTLFLLDSDGTDRAEQISDLIGSFGIALISTILGILFRILLLQIADDESEQLGHPSSVDNGLGQQRQSVDLADAAFKLRMELTQTIADMNEFRKAIIQASNETVLESNRAREAIIRQIEEAVHEQTRILSASAEQIQNSLGKITDGSKKIETVFSSVPESLQNIVNDLQLTVGKLDASVGHVQNSLDQMVHQQLQRAQHSAELTTQSTEKFERSIRDLLTKIAGSGEKIEVAFGSAPDSLQSIVSGLQLTTQKVETLVTQFTEVIRVKERTTVTLTDTTEEFCQTLRQEAGQWQAMTQKVQSSLMQAVEKFTQVVRNS